MNDRDIAVVLAARPFVSTCELALIGVSRADLARLLRSGRLERLTKGRYGVPRPGEAPEVRHARKALAILSRYDERTVLSHHSAVAVHGLPLVDADLEVVHLSRATRKRHRVGSDHVIHAVSALADVPVADRVVGVADALVQTGLHDGLRALAVSGDAALRAGLVTRADLDAAVARHRRHRDVGGVRAAVPILDGRAESPGESILRLICLQLGMPVVPQTVIATRHGQYRVDLALPGPRIAIEFDGLAKYDEPGAFRREKVREGHLADAGWLVIRFTWADLADPIGVGRRIRAVMARVAA